MSPLLFRSRRLNMGQRINRMLRVQNRGRFWQKRFVEARHLIKDVTSNGEDKTFLTETLRLRRIRMMRNAEASVSFLDGGIHLQFASRESPSFIVFLGLFSCLIDIPDGRKAPRGTSGFGSQTLCCWSETTAKCKFAGEQPKRMLETMWETGFILLMVRLSDQT